MSFQIQQNLTNVNCEWGCNSPQWIVIHNTANGTSREGTAWANTNFFKNTVRNASAHYFIDDGDTVWQCVNDWDTAWHIGDSWSRNGATNYNAIGIEVCETADGSFTEHEIAVLQWLVPMLMDKYGIDADHICRHHDVTTKICPAGYIDWGRWCELKDRILEEDDVITEEQIDQIARRAAQYVVWGHFTVDGKEGWTVGGALQNVSHDVWNEDIGGVRARDRLYGDDYASNAAKNNTEEILRKLDK